MNRLVNQGLGMIASFLAIWFLLQQVDWMGLFKVEDTTRKTEEKLGEMFWDIFHKPEEENANEFVIKSVDSLVSRLCEANNIDPAQIKLHILNKDEVNAFALPDGHLVIYSALILTTENQEELCGIIGHEIAHIELNHVMKRLVKEVGLSVLISMTTDGSGAETVRETAKTLSSTAFDRSWEKEADLKSVEYLVKANINPKPFADFLYRLSEEESELINYLSWVSTHPDSKERAAYIVEHVKDNERETEQILLQETWERMRTELEK